MKAHANHVPSRLVRSGSKLMVPKTSSPLGTLPPSPPEHTICRALMRHTEERMLSRSEDDVVTSWPNELRGQKEPEMHRAQHSFHGAH